MRFEWDDLKNEQNISKHGIDFADVPSVFESPMVIKLDDRHDYGEDRWIGIGILGNFIVVILFTEPQQDVIRIISVRRATRDERIELEQEIENRLG